MIVRRHGHHSPHTILVLEGSVTCDGRECGPGTHIELPHGASFGPFVAGPDGLVAYEVMMGDPRSWSDEPEAMAAALAEHGVTPLPGPAHRAPRRPRGPPGGVQRRFERAGLTLMADFGDPGRTRPPPHHLRGRPRHGAQGPVAAGAARVAAGAGAEGRHREGQAGVHRRPLRLLPQRPRRSAGATSGSSTTWSCPPACSTPRRACPARSSATSPPPTTTSAPAPGTRPSAWPT